MAHHPEPFYWAQRKGYFVDIPLGSKKKTRKKLVIGPENAETEAAAWTAYHAVMATLSYAMPSDPVIVALAADLFLTDSEGTVKANTHQQYSIKLQDFCRHYGDMKVEDLTADHVRLWLEAHEWSPSTRRGAITAVRVLLAWCERKKFVGGNVAKEVKRPKMGRRERTVTTAERQTIRAEFSDGFADFLDALSWTGCRPGEIMRLEAAHIDFAAAYAALPGKTTEATQELIEFPLIPPMLALCQRLVAESPTGPIFRNADGEPWTPNAVRCRMRRMRVRLKREDRGNADGVTAYTYRHSYATDALERGLPLTDIAGLMNHKDIRTTMNYNHVKERREHLKKQAEKATGG